MKVFQLFIGVLFLAHASFAVDAGPTGADFPNLICTGKSSHGFNMTWELRPSEGKIYWDVPGQYAATYDNHYYFLTTANGLQYEIEGGVVLGRWWGGYGGSYHKDEANPQGRLRVTTSFGSGLLDCKLDN